MTRNRGTVPGGYVRKTLSLPFTVESQLAEHLEDHPGMTASWVVTQAMEEFFAREKTKARRKR